MLSLKQTIDEFDVKKNSSVDGSILSEMAKETERLKKSGIEDKALKTGAVIQDFALPDQNGTIRHLKDFLAKGPVVLNIYRGQWCPYCNFEIAQLALLKPDFDKRGVTILGITPEKPQTEEDKASANDSGITVLTDEDSKLTQSWGLVFSLPENLRPIYKSFGIDIVKSYGNEGFKLPIPATYLLDKTGLIRHHFVDADYTKRQEPSDLLTVIDKLKSANNL